MALPSLEDDDDATTPYSLSPGASSPALSPSLLGASDDGDAAAASGDFDGSVVLMGDKYFDAQAFDDLVPHPAMPNVDVRISDALAGKDNASEQHEFVKLPPDSGAKECAPTHAVVLLRAEDGVIPEYSVADGELHHKLDEETDADGESPDDPSSNGDARGPLLRNHELDDNLPRPVSKGAHFGQDGDDWDEVDGKQLEHFEYAAALAELLRAANISPGLGQGGNGKVFFPFETSELRYLQSPNVISIPRTNMASRPVQEAVPDPESEMTDEEKKLYRKVNNARIKYLRLVHRLGYNADHQVPRHALHRLALAEGIKRVRAADHSSELENAWKRALQLEAEGTTEDLEFSCNILVLGKTGVGKSATINSIFGEERSKTNAFLPATSSVQEIIGVVDGVKLRVIDTPGLGTPAWDENSNTKVLNSVKKYLRRCPPDIVLYVDRIDNQQQDLALLQGITSVLGLSVWSKTIITLTHSGAALPEEGPSGSAMDYGAIVSHRTRSIQESIRQATNDPRIENPVALVENHYLCPKNTEGENVLPDGLTWRRLLLLQCYSLKTVAETDSSSSRRAPLASIFARYVQVPPFHFSSPELQVGDWLTLRANAGAVSMRDDTACEVNMEATAPGRNYPVGQGRTTTLGASLVRWRKEWTMAASIDSQFPVGRASNIAVHVDLNNKRAGRVSIKVSSSGQLQFALIGGILLWWMAKYLWNKRRHSSDPNYRSQVTRGINDKE